MKKTDAKPPIQCPSAQPSADSVIFGVVTGPKEERRVGYLIEAQPATDELLALSGPAAPAQVFRMASPCMGGGCKHFSGGDCQLAKRIVASFAPVVDGLPPCQIRPTCRWFRQEGKAACLRCPQVVTDTYEATDLQRWVADPDTAPAPSAVPSPEPSEE